MNSMAVSNISISTSDAELRVVPRKERYNEKMIMDCWSIPKMGTIQSHLPVGNALQDTEP